MSEIGEGVRDARDILRGAGRAMDAAYGGGARPEVVVPADRPAEPSSLPRVPPPRASQPINPPSPDLSSTSSSPGRAEPGKLEKVKAQGSELWRGGERFAGKLLGATLNRTFWYSTLTAATVAGVRTLATHMAGAEASEMTALAIGMGATALKEGLTESFKSWGKKDGKKKIAGAILSGAVVGAMSSEWGYRFAGGAGMDEVTAEMLKIGGTAALASLSNFIKETGKGIASGNKSEIFSGKTIKQAVISGVMAGAFTGLADHFKEPIGELFRGQTKPAEVGGLATPVPYEPPRSTDDLVEITTSPVPPPSATSRIGVGATPDALGSPSPGATARAYVETTQTPTSAIEPTNTPSSATTHAPINTSVAMAPSETLVTIPSETPTPTPTVTATATETQTATPTATPTETLTPTPSATHITEPATPIGVSGPEAGTGYGADYHPANEFQGEQSLPPTPSPAPATSGGADPVEGESAAPAPEVTYGPEFDTKAEAATNLYQTQQEALARLNLPSELINNKNIDLDMQNGIDHLVNANSPHLSAQEEYALHHLADQVPVGTEPNLLDTVNLKEGDEYYAGLDATKSLNVSSLKGLIEGRIGELILRDTDFLADRDKFINELLQDPKVDEGVKASLKRILDGSELPTDPKDFTEGNGAHQLLFEKFREANPDKFKRVFEASYVISKANTDPGLFTQADLFLHNKDIKVPKLDLMKTIYKM